MPPLTYSGSFRGTWIVGTLHSIALSRAGTGTRGSNPLPLVELDDPEQAHVGAGLQHFVLLERRAQANVVVEKIFAASANRHFRQHGPWLIDLEGIAHLRVQEIVAGVAVSKAANSFCAKACCRLTRANQWVSR